VRKKTFSGILRSGNPQPLSTAARLRTIDGSIAEARTGATPDCYPSTVCSIDDPALRRVVEAIDRLEADRRVTETADLEARIAAVWSMVSEIDPELARLASRYQNRAD
jgi:hypothetical protein